MGLVMVNPDFMNQSNPNYGIEEYTLVFDGFEGIGNVDEDGDEFYYYCSYWRDLSLSDGWNFIAHRVYEDDNTPAYFTKVGRDFVVQYMNDRIMELNGVENNEH